MNTSPKPIHKKSSSLVKPVSNQNIKNLVLRSNKYFKETTTFIAKIKENNSNLRSSFENQVNVSNRYSDGLKLDNDNNNLDNKSNHYFSKPPRSSKPPSAPSLLPNSSLHPSAPSLHPSSLHPSFLPSPPPSIPPSFLIPSPSSSLKLRNFNKIISLNSKGLQTFTLTQLFETHSLLILELKQNRLKLFPPDILKLKYLQTLKLDGNFLKELPDELFQNLEQLEILSVADNMLLKMPKNMSCCKKLKVLNLAENHLDALGGEIGLLVNLKSLMIQMNHFHLIPGNLGELKGLREFGLDWFKYLEMGLESVQMMQDGGERSVLGRFLELVGKESNHLTFPEFLEGMEERMREEEGGGGKEVGRRRREEVGGKRITKEERGGRSKKETIGGRGKREEDWKEGGKNGNGEKDKRTGGERRRDGGEGVKRIYEKGRTMLHKAAVENDIGVIRAILNSEYSMIDLLDSSEQTALFLAIRHENYLSAKVLLHSGSNPMISSHFLGSCLNLATVKGQYYLVADLLKFGDDPSRTDSEGNTPLHVLMCVFDSDPQTYSQIGSLLILSDCPPNKLNVHFLSPFHLAIRRCQIHALKWISQQNVFDINQLGGELIQTPLMMACEQGFVYGVQILLDMPGVDIWEGGGGVREEGARRKEKKGEGKEGEGNNKGGKERKEEGGEKKEEGGGRKEEGEGKEEEEGRGEDGRRRALSYSMKHYKVMKLIYCREKLELWNSVLKGLPKREEERGVGVGRGRGRREEEVESEEENTTFRKISDLNQITMEKRVALFKGEIRAKSLGFFIIKPGSKDIDRSMSDIEENKSDKENDSKLMRNFIGSPNNIRKLDFLQRLNSLLNERVEEGGEARREVGGGWKEIGGRRGGEGERMEGVGRREGGGLVEERKKDGGEKRGGGRGAEEEEWRREGGGKGQVTMRREGGRRWEGVARSMGSKLSLKSLSMQNLQETIGKLNALIDKLKGTAKFIKETILDNSQPISVKVTEINNLFYFQCELNCLVKIYKEERESIEHAQNILKANINTISIDLDKSMSDFLNSKTERHFFNLHNDDLALRHLFYIFLLLSSNISGFSLLKSQIIKIFEFFSFKNLLIMMTDQKYYYSNETFIIYESFQSVLVNDPLFFKKNNLKAILAGVMMDNNHLNNFRNFGVGLNLSKKAENSNELKPAHFFDEKMKVIPSEKEQRISISSKSNSGYILNSEDGRLIPYHKLDINHRTDDFEEKIKSSQNLKFNHNLSKASQKPSIIKPFEGHKNPDPLPNPKNDDSISRQTKPKTNRIFSDSTPPLKISDFPLLEINNLNFLKKNENSHNPKANGEVLIKENILKNDINVVKNNNLSGNGGNSSKNSNFLSINNFSLGLTEFTPEVTRNSALREEEEDGVYRIERMKMKEKNELDD